MKLLGRTRNFLADGLDRIRTPGWPRRIAVLVVLGLILLVPYPLSVTGEFEVISLRPVMVRNKVEGQLTEILVKMGDHVKAGQVVARLLDVELKLEKQRVAAELAEVEAQLTLARNGYRTEEVQMARFRAQGLAADVALKAANLTRANALYRVKDIPKAKLDEANSDYIQARKSLDESRQELKKMTTGFRVEEIDQAAAKVEQLKSRLALTEQHLEWTEIKAPIAGEVTTPDHELQRLVGSLLPVGAQVMEIVAPEDLVARVEVPESEFGDISLRQEVDLRTFQYPGRAYTGVIESIEPQVRQVTEFSSAVPVLTRVDDQAWRELRVHTRGRAKISLGMSPLGYVLYRRVLRSAFVRVWSWY